MNQNWIFLLFLLAFPVLGSDEVNQNPLDAVAVVQPHKLSPGATATLKIHLNLAPEHKAYTDMFKLQWLEPTGVKLGQFHVSPTFTFDDKFSKKTREAVKDKSEMTAAIEISEGFNFGEQKGQIELTYQACTDEYCLFPKKLKLETTFQVVSVEDMHRKSEPQGFMANTFDQAREKGLVFTFLFVFLAGLATSLTPCIFPMIPITLAVIGTRGQNRWRSFTLSLAYVFGIAITYALLGVIAAKTGALFGALLGNPWVVGVIASIFVLMALSMYGVFEFRVPAFIGQKLVGNQPGKGYRGAFLTGLLAGIVASPCVGPVLVGVLTYVAQTQDLVLGFFLLFTFALGLGQLFLVLGTFSNLTRYMPKSGPWMEAVSFLFGTTMVAVALYYIYPVANERVFAALLGLALILISSSFGAFEPNSQLKTAAARMRKALMLMIFIFGIGFSLKAVFGPQVFSYIGASGEGDKGVNLVKKLAWQPYSDALLSEAKTKNLPVIIDFWAEWCVACKELEYLTFPDERIQELSKKFVLLKVDATTDTEEIDRLKQTYKVFGLPTMIFIKSDGTVLWNLTLTGFEKAEPFLSRMNRTLK